MTSFQAILLKNGETLPIIGMGTYSVENDRETTEKAIKTALKVTELLAHFCSFSYFLVFSFALKFDLDV